MEITKDQAAKDRYRAIREQLDKEFKETGKIAYTHEPVTHKEFLRKLQKQHDSKK